MDISIAFLEQDDESGAFLDLTVRHQELLRLVYIQLLCESLEGELSPESVDSDCQVSVQEQHLVLGELGMIDDSTVHLGIERLETLQTQEHQSLAVQMHESLFSRDLENIHGGVKI